MLPANTGGRASRWEVPGTILLLHVRYAYSDFVNIVEQVHADEPRPPLSDRASMLSDSKLVSLQPCSQAHKRLLALR
jgi:hypothetical protein